jgi:hypothetical protein
MSQQSNCFWLLAAVAVGVLMETEDQRFQDTLAAAVAVVV